MMAVIPAVFLLGGLTATSNQAFAWGDWGGGSYSGQGRGYENSQTLSSNGRCRTFWKNHKLQHISSINKWITSG